MSISENIRLYTSQLAPYSATLIAVSKTYPTEAILEAYSEGQRHFGENKVQELVPKFEALPKDIHWHLIGHLQSNKVKYIAPFIYRIHSVDSNKLLKEINKEAQKNNRIIEVLLQVYIADEDTKYGMDFEEVEHLMKSNELKELKHIKIVGLMGMATNTEDLVKIGTEFQSLKLFFEQIKAEVDLPQVAFQELSMGMSSDYKIALQEGSTMVRIGSAIFGKRNYDLPN